MDLLVRIYGTSRGWLMLKFFHNGEAAGTYQCEWGAPQRRLMRRLAKSGFRFEMCKSCLKTYREEEREVGVDFQITNEKGW